MAQDVPATGVVGEERDAVGTAEPLPKRRDLEPETVDGRAPVPTGADHPQDVLSRCSLTSSRVEPHPEMSGWPPA